MGVGCQSTRCLPTLCCSGKLCPRPCCPLSASSIDPSPLDVRQISVIGSGERAPPQGYVGIDECTAACCAAKASTVANLVEEERKLGKEGHAHLRPSKDEDLALQDRIMYLRAVDDRNRTASTALQTLYHLAEAEWLRDVAERGHVHVNRTILMLEATREQGLEAPLDEAPLLAKRHDLLAQAALAEGGVISFDQQLKALLGTEQECEPRQIHPIVDLEASSIPMTPDEAAELALRTRADLGVLRTLAVCADERSLEKIQNQLRRKEATLGGGPPTIRLITSMFLFREKREKKRELETRLTQLEKVRIDLERGIVAEVRATHAKAESELERLSLAQNNLATQSKALEQFEQKQSVDAASAFDVANQKSRVLEAEAEVIRRLIDWKIAVTKFREAVGLLATECGYPTPTIPICASQSGSSAG